MEITINNGIIRVKDIPSDYLQEEILIDKYRYKIIDKPCNYGGIRKYFRCPNCKRAVYKLFYVGELYLCNKCSGYTKITLNRTKTNAGYFNGLALKELRKINPKYKGEVIFRVPEKPKYMRDKKYRKILKKMAYYIDKQTEMMGRWLK